MPPPTSSLRRWLLCLVLFAGAGGGALAAEADRSSIRGYAAWSENVLNSPPEGIEVLDALETRLLELVAKRRQEANADLLQLEVDERLADAARVHAIDMLQRDYVGHVGPDGRDASDRIGILHRRFVGNAGENLAEHEGLGMAELEDQTGPIAIKLVDGFMESEGHRANIVEPKYTHHGIAAVGRGERLLVVHVFGARQAMLEEPLPLAVSTGDELPLAFEHAESLRVPAQYGFAHLDQPADEIVTLELSSDEVAVDPGEWRLKFLLPSGEEGLFDVANGPIIVVE